MNRINCLQVKRVVHCFSILFLLFVSGCAGLPDQKTGVFDRRRVEYSLIGNNGGAGVVVFENGLNGKMAWWHKVIPEISKEATTFAYNRPGYGSSDPVATPRDGLHIVDELRLLLTSNGLKPPYVLVGHSRSVAY